MLYSSSIIPTYKTVLATTGKNRLYNKFESICRGSLIIICLAVMMSAKAGSKQSSLKAELPPVIAILRQQEAAWNNGDINRFMEHYWKSDKLTFSSGGTTTRGWENTLKNYRRRYPNPERMGKVRFDNLEVFPLGETAALVLGRYFLERKPTPLQGNFSLVFQKIDGRWVIIHDHTSQTPDKKDQTGQNVPTSEKES